MLPGGSALTGSEGLVIGVLTSGATVIATGLYFTTTGRTARAAALAGVVAVVLGSGLLAATLGTRPGGQPTPAPVESGRPPAPTCPPGTLGPQWLDQRWVCIPYDQAG